jgi:hypothetical protein
MMTPSSCMYANQAALTAMNSSWEELAGPAAAQVAAQHQEVSALDPMPSCCMHMHTGCMCSSASHPSSVARQSLLRGIGHGLESLSAE